MIPSRAFARLLILAALMPSCGLLSSLGGGSSDGKAASPTAQPTSPPGEAQPTGEPSVPAAVSADEVESLRSELAKLRDQDARRADESEAREYDLRLELDRIRAQLASWQQERPPVPWTLWLAGASLLAAILAILSSWQSSRSAARLRRLIESLEVEIALPSAGPSNPLEPQKRADVPAVASEPASGPPPASRPVARLRKRPPVG